MKYIIVTLIVLYILYGCFVDNNRDKCVIKQLKAGNISGDKRCSKRSHGPRCYGCVCNKETIDE